MALEEFKKNKTTDFMMNVSVSREINIKWLPLEELLKEESIVGKKLVFIDPIVLYENKSLIEIEISTNNVVFFPISVNEDSKELETLEKVLDTLDQEGIGRTTDMIYAVGGGVLLDVVSLACSVFRRGIHMIKVPTTLLAFVDASIGIKTAVNFKGIRNRIGSYNSRFDVVLDPILIETNNRSLIIQGLGEIFKIALIKSENLFNFILQNKNKFLSKGFFQTEAGLYILTDSLRLMLEEIHENPEELILKRCVDFGHTFSPLVEMESVKNPKYRKLHHGFSVAFDCFFTSFISFSRGILSESNFKKITDLYQLFDFDFKNSVYQDDDLMWASVLEMKKHRGMNQHIPIPTSIGSYIFIEDLSYNEFIDLKQKFMALLK